MEEILLDFIKEIMTAANAPETVTLAELEQLTGRRASTVSKAVRTLRKRKDVYVKDWHKPKRHPIQCFAWSYTRRNADKARPKPLTRKQIMRNYKIRNQALNNARSRVTPPTPFSVLKGLSPTLKAITTL